MRQHVSNQANSVTTIIIAMTNVHSKSLPLRSVAHAKQSTAPPPPSNPLLHECLAYILMSILEENTLAVTTTPPRGTPTCCLSQTQPPKIRSFCLSCCPPFSSQHQHLPATTLRTHSADMQPHCLNCRVQTLKEKQAQALQRQTKQQGKRVCCHCPTYGKLRPEVRL
jgi:hypothetical protein